MAKTAEYSSWVSMKSRCYNSRTERYGRYGGRGITVCERWRNSFENFLADMGPKPTRLHTIDRKDSDGNYEPSNCKWSTKLEQAQNRTNNRLFTFYGKTLPLCEWSRISQVRDRTICSRLLAGWTPKEAVWTPVARAKRRLHAGPNRTNQCVQINEVAFTGMN